MRNRRKTAGKKGFSSVVGAVFMVLIMMVLASSYFVYSLSQNNVYNNAVAQKNQLNVDRLSESTHVINTTYTPYTDGKVTVYAQIKNIGASSIQFLTVWLKVYNASWTNYNHSNLTDANVQGGSTFTLPPLNLTVSGFNSNFAYSFASWLITARGNVVPLQQTIVSANNIIVSQTTQGIGALMMDFQNFTYYSVTGSGPNYYLSPYPNGVSAYYVQNARTNKIAFRVILTDLDRDGRDITLTQGSVLFIVYPSSGGNYVGDRWYMVKVNETNGEVYSTISSVTLSFNQPKSVYFASSSQGTVVPATSSLQPSQLPNIGAVNLALVGQIGSDPFGQNIPFVSINVVS